MSHVLDVSMTALDGIIYSIKRFIAKFASIFATRFMRLKKMTKKVLISLDELLEILHSEHTVNSLIKWFYAQPDAALSKMETTGVKNEN